MFHATHNKHQSVLPFTVRTLSVKTLSVRGLQTLCCGALLFVAGVANSSESADTDIAADFGNSLDAMISLVQSSAPDTAQLSKYIDFPTITRGVLAKHGKQLSQDQTTRFQGVFEKSMFTLLQSATKAIGLFNIEVTQTKISPKRKTRAQAYADIQPEKGKAIAIIASMRQQASGWKVTNLIVDGVNLGLTYRNQFDQLMQKHGGQADQAIDEWAASTSSPPSS